MLCIVMYTDVYTIWVRKSARMPENAIEFGIAAS